MSPETKSVLHCDIVTHSLNPGLSLIPGFYNLTPCLELNCISLNCNEFYYSAFNFTALHCTALNCTYLYCAKLNFCASKRSVVIICLTHKSRKMLRLGHWNRNEHGRFQQFNLTFLITQDIGHSMLKLCCTWTEFIEYAASSELVQCLNCSLKIYILQCWNC